MLDLELLSLFFFFFFLGCRTSARLLRVHLDLCEVVDIHKYFKSLQTKVGVFTVIAT